MTSVHNSHGVVLQGVKISPEDFERVNHYNWRISKKVTSTKTYYYVNGDVNGFPILLHHFIYGKPKNGYVIDHIDNDGLNNSRENLREITRQQNSQNKKKTIRQTSSQYIGVCYNKQLKKWMAKCSKIYLGVFESEHDAACAYDNASYTLYGRGAKTNELVKFEDFVKIDINIKEKIERELPKNIIRTKDGQFYAQIQHNKIKFKSTYYIMLERAIEALSIFKLEIKKMHIEPTLTRNSEGFAIINVTDENNKIVRECLVDDDVWEQFSKVKWNVSGKYAKTTFQGKFNFMHHIVMGVDAYELVDHISSNKNDNRKSNLRVSNYSNNNHNKPSKSGSSSKYKGVCRPKKSNKWFASIRKNNVVYSLGSYDNEIEAAKAYNKKAMELYGEFACVNEIE